MRKSLSEHSSTAVPQKANVVLTGQERPWATATNHRSEFPAIGQETL